MSTAPRPRIITVAFWLTMVGAVLLLAGGLVGVSTSLTTPASAFPDSLGEGQAHRILLMHGGVGAVLAVAGLGLSFLAGRTRNGDKRFRRALAALAGGVVFVVFLLALFAPYNLELLALIGVVPVAVGATLFTRPAAAAWFEDAT
ncbi:hypothetical protein C1S82_09465 [Mycolicibacterium cosmeticum]|uniref:Transmembrane protein n=1 Tax=Mycolicibacterium cosmeticum TaxID=258533 RepID=W9B3Z3_MYCCO|nr:hypothetical protein [Mycolicibacterium cosmeticum]TLH74793.1 hypothetical protein C1S82_09465 [Mycolicibacterium cosmeticum]CDO09506.1 hypothetical protein BN977_04329 [Mycolicibacterium cosmeticum]